LKQITLSVLGSASVVVTTCNGGDSTDLRQYYAPGVVIFEEVAQTNKPDTLISPVGM
jgi:hypothetical protein